MADEADRVGDKPRYRDGKKTAGSTLQRILTMELIIWQTSRSWTPKEIRDRLATEDVEYDVDINTIRRNLQLLEQLNRVERIDGAPPRYRRPKQHPIYRKSDGVTDMRRVAGRAALLRHYKRDADLVHLKLDAHWRHNCLINGGGPAELSFVYDPSELDVAIGSLEHALTRLAQSHPDDPPHEQIIELGGRSYKLAPALMQSFCDALIAESLRRESRVDFSQHSKE